jgi:hypothetical protein
VALYTKPRYTKDIDILVEPNKNNGRNIVKALNEFGFKSLGLTETDFTSGGKIIQLGYEPLRVDLITSIGGASFEEVWKNKKTAGYGKEKVFFIGKKELIKAKKASNRKQDKADLEMLLPDKVSHGA